MCPWNLSPRFARSVTGSLAAPVPPSPHVSPANAIMSPVMITGGTREASVGTGFGFLPGFVVDQHFKQRNRFARLLGVGYRLYRCLFDTRHAWRL